MNTDQILAEIREANLSYLMLAQTLIRTDRDQALYRLGLSEDSAGMIAALTPAQMMKIASGNTLLCRMRCDDDLVWGLLTSHGKSAAKGGEVFRDHSWCSGYLSAVGLEVPNVQGVAAPGGF